MNDLRGGPEPPPVSRSDMKNKKAIILLSVLFLIAGLIAAYPVVSNKLFEANSAKVQTEYFQVVEQLEDATIQEARAAAESYNALLTKGLSFSDEQLNSAAVKYDELLNPGGKGIMAYIEIPTLGLSLPVAHGTEAETLENYVGHVIGSSLPIGGESSHAILSGHSGLAGKAMFTDLHELKEGDIIFIHVLNDTLAYSVDELNTVLPDNISGLSIRPGEDSLTLITCTPVGVNTHRLLVQCSRTEYSPEQAEGAVAEQSSGSTWESEYKKGLAYGLLALLLGFIVYGLIQAGRNYYAQRH